jgi:hypothetical protein
MGQGRNGYQKKKGRRCRETKKEEQMECIFPMWVPAMDDDAVWETAAAVDAVAEVRAETREGPVGSQNLE